MHEEKSRFYWYQFSDYTLVWPTNANKSSEMAAFFCFFSRHGGRFVCTDEKKHLI